MKFQVIIFSFVLLTSCAVNEYYQVYKTTSLEAKETPENIVFEDANCEIYYNLWSDGGDPGFDIFNKSDSDITIMLSKSFFILNGVAYEYFQNRIFSKSINSSATIASNYYPVNFNVHKVSGTNGASLSTAFIEKSDLTIPAKTKVRISEFHISTTRIVNCDLSKFPTKKTMKTLYFNEENSPIVFYNLITYSTPNDTLRIENNFFVNEITNYPASYMFTTIDTSFCGKELEEPINVFINPDADKFYIKYFKSK